jgi:transcriptional antiterminator RfaH
VEQWFAVKTKPRLEEQAKAVLAQRGIEVYLPYLPARPRRGRRVAPVEILFPGYLFARLAIGTPQWVAARSAPGVAYFLGSGGIPSALPEELIDLIRTRCEAHQRDGWKPPFKRGDRVQIQRGPFAGLEAVFECALSASGRVRVLLEVVKRLIPVDMDCGLLAQPQTLRLPAALPVAGSDRHLEAARDARRVMAPAGKLADATDLYPRRRDADLAGAGARGAKRRVAG